MLVKSRTLHVVGWKKQRTLTEIKWVKRLGSDVRMSNKTFENVARSNI
jgi:hypothetical protein